MSQFDLGWRPDWFRDISSAFAVAKQAAPVRRLQAFLATLSSETLRLAVSETAEPAGEGFGLGYGLPIGVVQRLQQRGFRRCFGSINAACPGDADPRIVTTARRCFHNHA